MVFCFNCVQKSTSKLQVAFGTSHFFFAPLHHRSSAVIALTKGRKRPTAIHLQILPILPRRQHVSAGLHATDTLWMHWCIHLLLTQMTTVSRQSSVFKLRAVAIIWNGYGRHGRLHLLFYSALSCCLSSRYWNNCIKSNLSIIGFSVIDDFL